MNRRTSPAAIVVAVVALASSLSACSSGGGYTLTASFPRAVALYEESTVKVMGVDVGEVTDVAVEDDHIEVTMRIDEDIPLPADVGASILPLTLIGERNVVLSPPWKPGEDRARDGDSIPIERTEVPVEPDEALEAFDELARAIDPEAVERLVTSGADNIDGRGASLNDALRQTSDLAGTLAAQDEQLLEAAEQLADLAATLDTRSDQLGDVIDSFAVATDVLAAEREGITRFLDGVVRLTDAGQRLLAAHEGTLPADMATLARLALTLAENSGSLEQVIAAFPQTSEAQLRSFRPDVGERGAITLNVNFLQTGAAGIQPLFDLFGLPVPCVPVGGQGCDDGLLP